MSKTFEVVSVNGSKVTINASHVVMVTSSDKDEVTICLSNGQSVVTDQATYRSIRGYLNKGLANNSVDE